MRLLACVVVVLGCGGNDSGAGPGEGEDGGGVCEPFSQTLCDDGDLFWADSCGVRGDLREECPVGRICIDNRDACCRLPASEGNYSGFNRPVDVFWTASGGSGFTYTGEILQATTGASTYGQTIGHQARVGNDSVSISLRTTVAHPQMGRIDQGVIIQLNAINDEARGQAGPDGWVNGGIFLGAEFTNIGAAIPWTVGPFTLEFVREEESNGRWWWAGYLEQPSIPRRLVGRVLLDGDSLGAEQSVFTQIYHTPTASFEFAQTPAFELSFAYRQDDLPPEGASVAFNPDANGSPFFNADVSYDPATGEVRVAQGAGVGRCGEDRELF